MALASMRAQRPQARLRPYQKAIVPALAARWIVTVIGGFYLSQTTGGREIYAVGGNEEAARFSGLRTKRIKLRVYAIAGLTAGIAGMVWLGRFGATSTGSAYGYELTVIAAAVVGGASLTGGKGTALGALLGTIIIAMIQDAIITLHWKIEYQLIIVGSAIFGHERPWEAADAIREAVSTSASSPGA